MGSAALRPYAHFFFLGGFEDAKGLRREAILRALSEGQVRSDDRRALFVGAKAYEDAGGTVVRDLFDAEGGGFFADAALLDRLAREKLQTYAEAVTSEGWRWVVADVEFDHEASAGMRRVFAKPVKLSGKERKKLRQLDARYKALFDKYADGDVPPEAAAKLDRIEAAVEALNRQEYADKDRVLAGAFVSLAHDGSARAGIPVDVPLRPFGRGAHGPSCALRFAYRERDPHAAPDQRRSRPRRHTCARGRLGHDDLLATPGRQLSHAGQQGAYP